MKISYFLHNISGEGRKIPAGEAWQWHHNIEDLEQANTLFTHLKTRILENRLALANLYVDKAQVREADPDIVALLGDAPIEYIESLKAKRIISKHEDFLDEEGPRRKWTLSSHDY